MSISNPCPVLPLALEHKALVTEHDRLDCARTHARRTNDEQQYLFDRDMLAIWLRLDAVKVQASYLRPCSNAGVAFLVSIPHSLADDVSGETTFEQQETNALMKRCLFRTTQYLVTGDQRFSTTLQFNMGSHDPQTVIDAVSAGKAVQS